MSRKSLRAVLKLLLFLAAGFALYPFLSSLTSREPNPDAAKNAAMVIRLDGLAPGELLMQPVPAGIVWVYHRRVNEVDGLHGNTAHLVDPASLKSRQPAAVQNPHRSLHSAYFVFLPFESRRGCQVSYLGPSEPVDLPGWQGGFFEPCYQAYFDLAGRRYKGTGHEEQVNLEVPPHGFRDKNTVLIGLNPGKTAG